MYLYLIKKEIFGKSLYFIFLKICKDVYFINNVLEGYLFFYFIVVVDYYLVIRASVIWVW